MKMKDQLITEQRAMIERCVEIEIELKNFKPRKLGENYHLDYLKGELERLKKELRDQGIACNEPLSRDKEENPLMENSEEKPFRAFNWGKGKMEISSKHLPLVVMRPIEIHLKEDGSLTSQPTFAIVMTEKLREIRKGVSEQGQSAIGEISLEMLNEGLNDIGYEIVHKEKTVCIHEWDEGSHNVHKCIKCGKYNC